MAYYLAIVFYNHPYGPTSHCIKAKSEQEAGDFFEENTKQISPRPNEIFGVCIVEAGPKTVKKRKQGIGGKIWNI